MRTLPILTLAVALAITAGCSRGDAGRQVPDGDGWRQGVVTAIEDTPGVSSSSVVVQDSDNGAGRSGPLLFGSIKVLGEPKPIADEAMRRVSDVLGPNSGGVRINIHISSDGGPARKLRQYGYDGVSDGAALWTATH